MTRPLTTWASLGHDDGAPIIAVTFDGVYPAGSEGNEFAGHMTEFLRTVTAQAGAAGVVIDLTQLHYVMGDGIGNLALALIDESENFRPAVIVATDETAAALRPLFGPTFLLGLAGIKLAATRENALALVT